MVNSIQLQSDGIREEIQDMEQKLTRLRDALRIMEEQVQILQSKWEGQASSEWTVQFLKDREMVWERVERLKQMVGVLLQIGLLLAFTERKNRGIVEGESCE